MKTQIDVKSLNNRVKRSPIELIDFAERNYFLQIKNAADAIIQKRDAKIMLLAGPSASSKTTTASKLMEELAKSNINSIVISLDDFYLNRENLPSLENGEIDFETINTLDLQKLSDCFGELIETKKTQIPLFDFATGTRTSLTKEVTVDENSIIIMEGLHALNPVIMNGYDKKNFLKLYICPTSDYCVDNETILSSQDIRLIRRIIRDHYYRSSTISKTLDMWQNVILAEVDSILPFKDNADFIIDSTVIYEPNVYADCFLSLAKECPPELICHEQLNFLIKAMESFISIPMELAPADTVLREFLPAKIVKKHYLPV